MERKDSRAKNKSEALEKSTPFYDVGITTFIDLTEKGCFIIFIWRP
jgi:hypothetical protein